MFGIRRTFLFHVLLYYLFNSFISDLLAASTSKCVPQIGKRQQPEVKVIATRDKRIAQKIYEKHGVGNTKMCKRVDGKTFYNEGYSLCKRAVIGNEMILNEDSEIISAMCSWVRLGPFYYKHAELANTLFSKKDNDDDRRVIFVANKFRDNYGHIMVECIQNHKLDFRSKAFRLLHAKDDIYYIFDNRSTWPDIVKTALLKSDESDYPTITVQETNKCLLMDNIFGIYGVMESKNPKHVCQKNKNSSMLVGQSLCGRAVEKYESGLHVLNEMPSTCANVDFRRFDRKDHIPMGINCNSMYKE